MMWSRLMVGLGLCFLVGVAWTRRPLPTRMPSETGGGQPVPWRRVARVRAAIAATTASIPPHRLRASAALLLVGLVATVGWASLFIAGAVAASVGLATRVAEHRNAVARDQSVHVVCESIARSLRSGASMPVAVEHAITQACPPMARTWLPVHAKLSRGMAFSAAFETWQPSINPHALRVMSTLVSAGLRNGGPAAELFDDFAAGRRQQLELQSETTALVSQAKASAALLVMLPMVCVPLLGALDPRSIHFLIGSRQGAGVIIAAITLDSLGALWMYRLMKRVAS